MEGKISSFTQLFAWQEAHKLVLMIYKEVRKFPNEELFGLSSQLKRAVVSITSNIAEGFGRQHYKEKIQFYYLAQGSNTEVQNQILIARDVGYINNIKFIKLANQTVSVGKLLSGLIKKSRTKVNS
jgi:four helix bundle protein